VRVEPEDLPGADDLWWSWVVLAALHRAVGNDACRLDSRTLVLVLDHPDGAWLRMRRTHGSRAVLWGRSALAPAHHPDARRDVPDWALSDALDEGRPSFVAWFSHGEWDTTTTVEDEGAVHLLRPLLTVDPKVVELSRLGRLTPYELAQYAHGDRVKEAADLVAAASAAPAPVWAGSVQHRLRDQIHDQMREAPEADRLLMRRPPILVQWSRVNGPAMPFEHSVMAVRDRLLCCPTNTRLPEPAARSLTNVLQTLHTEEAADDSGAWLFARVTSDGVVVNLDRAFDSWPEWYRTAHPSQGPALEDLAWEMEQRKPRWRPAWASLLPPG
jgi:hypothetical protein